MVGLFHCVRGRGRPFLIALAILWSPEERRANFMRDLRNWIGFISIAAAMAVVPAYGKKPLELGGTACLTPPPLHCPDKDCPGKMVTEGGATI